MGGQGLGWWSEIDPVTALLVLAGGWAFFHTARRLGAGLTSRQRWALVGAGMACYLGFGGPLEVLDHRLLAAYLLQSTLLSMVAAPLLLVATPPRLASRVLSGPLTEGWRILTRPVAAIVLFTGVLSVPLVPSVYDRVLEAGSLGLLADHLALTVTAVGLWWPVLSPHPALPRLHPGLQLLYLFLAGIPMILPQALITLAGTPLYPAYHAVPPLFGLSRVGDQQLGGGIALLGMHLGLGAAFVYAFRAWLHQERRAGRIPTPPPPLTVIRPDTGERRPVRPRSSRSSSR
ncbi:MAG: cytochrome c oxidase assembly protein [Firmicutes bacterium]|nr:cytochrome c oxidase assembly protein [Alicyclobacillaceae bacterium]MCL6497432.1 cytochrome c oxidase assembly protein [Bacillota bacterium]